MDEISGNSYYRTISLLSDRMRDSGEWSEIFQQVINMAKIYSNSYIAIADYIKNIQANIVPMVLRQAEAIRGLASGMDMDAVKKFMSAQGKILAVATKCIKTSEIEALVKSIHDANCLQGMRDFASAIGEASSTKAANFALLRLTKSDSEPLMDSCPRGMKTFVDKFQVKTAERLANNERIEAGFAKRKAWPIDNEECALTVDGLNVATGFADLFSEFSEEDLIEFINALDKETEFASAHPVGKRIWEIIAKWECFADFDFDSCYFHARRMKENGCAFTAREMGKAPDNLAGFGRFNHGNESHYYFADTEKGARAEVKNTTGGMLRYRWLA